MKRICIVLSFSIFLSSFTQAQKGNISTEEDRKALFDYIIAKTKEREAFSEPKNKALKFDPVQNMMALEEEFINATTNNELWFALKKLSAARHDKHLYIDVVDGGLKEPDIAKGQAPIRFHPDFSSKDKTVFFISDFSKDISTHSNGVLPKIGDQLIDINGIPLEEYIDQIKVYTKFSNLKNFLIRSADAISEKGPHLPKKFFNDTFKITLKPKKGKKYTLTLPYLNDVEWQYGRFLRNYKGYNLAWKTDTFWLYVPNDTDNKSLLLWWYGFRSDLQQATNKLVDYAREHQMLDYDLIIDAVNSRGGSQGAYALARFSPKPFKTTGGNLKLSDITDDFIAKNTRRFTEQKAIMDGESAETEDDGSRLMEWLHGPVLKGLANRQAYSNNVPFKCAHLPYYSDWIMQPAKEHFTGQLVLFSGPWGGSHMDQFSAMINDNDMGYSIGMPSGGYSNTWEWEEELQFPISKKPVAQFMWNIGHTIRPNGQILEGNPAQVDEYVPVTKENYLDYKNILLQKALTLLDAE
ncbi:hypothetical protein [Spongiimicrobium sp. 3-5]|uniref:hypothetical protein n=1 Tax=Spongiimicrobium sp. 3-5 TaxID=3332596 RepID=UPI00397F22ED